MRLNLNIYNGKEIEKVYTANEFDIMFGTVEDLINLIDVDRLSGSASDMDFIGAIMTLLKGGFSQIKTLVMELFPGVTEDELKRAKIKEVVQILMDVLKYGLAEMSSASSGKN